MIIFIIIKSSFLHSFGLFCCFSTFLSIHFHRCKHLMLRIFLWLLWLKHRGWQTTVHDPLSNMPPVLVNSFIGTQPHSFTYCLVAFMLHQKSLKSWNRDHMVHKLKNIYYLSFYKKKLTDPCYNFLVLMCHVKKSGNFVYIFTLSQGLFGSTFVSFQIEGLFKFLN